MRSTVHTVVVTDVARPADLGRCVTQVRRSVPRDVEVVVITSRTRPLPPGAARSVRFVTVEPGEPFTDAVASEAGRERLVVVLRSDCKVAPGWFEPVVARCRRSPDRVGTLGGHDAHLLAFPADVRSVAVEHEPWEPLPGVRLVTGASPRSATSATLGASLIVKDEEENIAECLIALRDVVDEIVVYDTGSSDRTVEIARAHGAVVHLGHWDDHFGDARNRALAFSTTEWVFHVDADEVFTGDAAGLRARLVDERADMVPVVIVSTQWRGATEGQEIRPVRIFRREKFRWSGQLHEHVVPREGVSGVMLSSVCADVRLLHSGYQRTAVDDKSKVARNVDIALAATRTLRPDDPQASMVWSNYGRALVGAGRTDEAFDALEHLFAPGGNPTAIVAGARSAVQLLFAEGREGDLDRWLDLLAEHGEASGNLAAVRARRSIMRQDLDAAERELDAIVDGLDVWGASYDRVVVKALRVDIATARGRSLDAAELLRRELHEHPETVDVGQLLRGTLDAGESLERLAGSSPEAFVARSLRVAFELPQALALRWFGALVSAHPDDPRALVAACVAASHGDLETVLGWSVRARERGFPELCPVRDAAAQTRRSPAERALLWAVLADAFDEADAVDRLRETLAHVAPEDAGTLEDAIADLTPALSPLVMDHVGAR